MSSVFPQSIDSFANPTYIKVDGVDLVKAAHVVDLQDSVRSVQELLAGAGKEISYDSTNYISDDTSYKVCLEALDTALGSLYTSFNAHRTYTLPTDPSQHHAYVIGVTPIGNLSASNVQNALVQHQVNIDAIMTGGIVNGYSLDSRYVMKSGSQSLEGDITIAKGLQVGLDSNLIGSVTVGSLVSNGEITINGLINAKNDISMIEGTKISVLDYENASFIDFSEDVGVSSRGNFWVRLDADDALDGEALDAHFYIYNGLGSEVVSINESGDVLSAGSISSSLVNTNTVVLNSVSSLSENGIDTSASSFLVKLDNGDSSSESSFTITKNNDSGDNEVSTSLLFKIDEDARLLTGNHELKSGVQEEGYFGLTTYSNNAGGIFYGAGVNFKTKMANTPSSITLSIDEESNISNLSVTHVDEYGFFFVFDTPEVGSASVRGHYITVGN